jgi:hypothetical protein
MRLVTMNHFNTGVANACGFDPHQHGGVRQSAQFKRLDLQWLADLRQYCGTELHAMGRPAALS